MALPPGISTTTITFGPYTDAAGAVALVGAKGVLFPVDPSTNKRVRVTHIGSGQVVVPAALPITIGSDGTASVGPIPHTGQASLTPSGFAWRVEWPGIQSGDKHPSPGNLTFLVPSGVTADFDLLVPAATVPAVAISVPGIPSGGTTGQVLAKASNADRDTAWVAQTGGAGGGAVASVNGQVGVVVLNAGHVGAQPAGDYATNTALTTGLAAKADTTDPRLTDARTPAAHTHPASQVSDSTPTGRAVLTAADATAARTAIGAGTSSLAIGTSGTTAAAGNDARLSDTRTPTDISVTDAKVAAGAAINADKLADGTTNKLLTATERTKLAGIATGATANAADATLLARANHTGTQAATTITGLATVATSGSYTDLSSKPAIPAVGAAGTAGAALSATDPTTTNARTPSAHTHPAADLTATGTRDATTYLRGDNTWAPPAGGGGATSVPSTMLFSVAPGTLIRAPQLPINTGSAQLGANTLYAVPLFLTAPVTVTKLGLMLWGNGSAGSVVRLGIYSDSSAYPGSLIVDAGTINGTTGSNGIVTLTLGSPVTIQPGTYWPVLAAQGGATTPPFAIFTGGITALISAATIPNGIGGYSAGGVSGALPATYPAGASLIKEATSGQVPAVIIGA